MVTGRGYDIHLAVSLCAAKSKCDLKYVSPVFQYWCRDIHHVLRWAGKAVRTDTLLGVGLYASHSNICCIGSDYPQGILFYIKEIEIINDSQENPLLLVWQTGKDVL